MSDWYKFKMELIYNLYIKHSLYYRYNNFLFSNTEVMCIIMDKYIFYIFCQMLIVGYWW